jgi:hypothetical protein
MNRQPKHLTAELIADLRPTLHGWTDPIAWGIGWEGAIYAAARRSEEVITEEHGIGIFLKSTLESSTDYLVLRWMQGQVNTLIHRNESLLASYIQPFPSGFLLAGARCRWHTEGAEKNAVAFDWNDHEMGRFTLGDGIQDLRVTREGTIWVSYFDEGIFGNYGWDDPGPTPMGATGLVAFSPTGKVHFSYDAAAANTDSICDAYAINVTNNGDVWIYFYDEFPVVRICQGTYKSWKLGVAGAHALAIQGNRVLLFGGYEQKNMGRIIQLRDDGDSEVIEEIAIEAPSGEPLDSAYAMGSGEKLLLFINRQVMLIDNW